MQLGCWQTHKGMLQHVSDILLCCPHPCCCSAAACADYVFAERKFGGNAQAITNKRWLHHTSFLWDYDPDNMAVLKNPRKQPQYRQVKMQKGACS